MSFLSKIVWFCLILCNFQLQAEIYKWVDAQGNISYSDQKPENQPSQNIIIKDNNSNQEQTTQQDKVTKFKPLFGNHNSENKKAKSRKKKLTMYSASWCGYCKQARQYFKKNHIRFTEYDIEKNQTAKRKYDKLGGSGVPLIVTGKDQMQGFSVAKFNRFYEN